MYKEGHFQPAISGGAVMPVQGQPHSDRTQAALEGSGSPIAGSLSMVV